MATIRKQGIRPNPPVRDHIGEDKSFGRASLLMTALIQRGLNPHNAVACDEPVEAEAVVTPMVTPTPGHTCH
ncbi:MAG: hypothetical protein DCF29_11975 [Alphaproteobacteria bacterium]|nr:MAG: hypothetical protein DCF29_11975 [Alphaproteobacteria bacterium]